MSIVQALVDTYKTLVRKNILIGSPHPLDIARGKIAGARQAQIEGYAGSTIVGLHDVSDLGVLTIPIPSLAGESMTIVSTSANDTVLGTGARTVIIEYIEPITEDLKWIQVELNGTTPVLVPVTIAFVSDFYVNSCATINGTSLGDIKIYKTGTPATVYNIIKAQRNKSASSLRYVPKNKVLYITSFTVSSSTKAISVRLRATQADTLSIPISNFIFRSVAIMADSPITIPFDPPIAILGGNYIKASSIVPSGSSGAMLATGLNGWIEQKDPSTLNN